MAATNGTTRYCHLMACVFGTVILGLLLAFIGVQQAWAGVTLTTDDGFRYKALGNGSIEITEYIRAKKLALK